MNGKESLSATSEGQPRRIEWFSVALALALLTTLIPGYGPSMVTRHPWRPELLISLVLFGAVLTRYWADRHSILGLFQIQFGSTRLVVRCVAIFAIWGLVSGIWATSFYSVLNHTLVWTVYILLFLHFYGRFRESNSIRLATDSFLFLAAIIGILCLVDYLSLPDFKSMEGTLRIRYGKYAELLVTIAPIMWILAVYQRKRFTSLLVMTVAAAGWMVAMLSLSKGAFLAGLIGFVIMFAGILVCGPRRLRRRIAPSFAIWLVVTLAVQIGFSVFSSIPATTDYITGKADSTRETSTSRIFFWSVDRQMIADNWLVGVGADNFGVAFNRSRANYRISHPDQPKDEIVSDYLLERAHNEVLQTTAELGVVGLLLLLFPFAVFSFSLIRAFVHNRFRLSPVLWAAIGGLVAFGISSMVSSFSFRIVQNGLVFFIVLAIAMREIAKTNRANSIQIRIANGRRLPPFIPGIVLLSSVMIIVISLLKAGAEYNIYRGDLDTDSTTAIKRYQTALTLDPDYSGAYLRIAGRRSQEEDFAQSAVFMRKAIDGGLGVVLSYSVLADSFEKSGDQAAVDATFDEALSIFPRSVFLRVRYAIILESEGRIDEANAQMLYAHNIDPKQAIGWQNLIKLGSLAAFTAARSNPDIALPADLLPHAAVLQYLDDPPGMQK